MARLSSLFLLLLVLIFLTFGGLIVSSSLRSTHLGSYGFLWRNASDATFCNESCVVNLSLQRIAEDYYANLSVSFEGGLDSDLVRVGGVVVGNLSGSSPKVFSVSPSYLDLTTSVNYTFNASTTNVTYTYLDYYSWSGCNYDIDTCESLDMSFSVVGALWIVPSIFIFLVVVLIIVSVVGWYG